MQFVRMWPKDKVDSYLTVSEVSDPVGWLSGVFSSKTYYGSGSCWFDLRGKRVGEWKSSKLHTLWNDGLNKEIERKNCKWTSLTN